MNDIHTAPSDGSVGEEKPPRFWQRLMRTFFAPFFRSGDVSSLREAMEEMIVETSGPAPMQAAEREILTNVIALHDKEVGDCMVPRGQIVAAEVDAPQEELLDLMTKQGFSRIPVYRETMDEMLGFVHVKDVLACLARNKKCVIRELLRPVLFVAPSMPVSHLMAQMRAARRHMAMVVDEFGGIDGLVTIEDLVEEIVGEIEDEHDAPGPAPMIVRADGTLLADTSVPIEEFEARVGPLLSPEERQTIDTLAGLVFHLAGRIPSIGETVKGPGDILFDILESDANRIKRVRVRRPKN